jgi:transposase-like protein
MDGFKGKWDYKYHKPVLNMERKLGHLFTYFEYPNSIRKSCINAIQPKGQIRRRIKVIDSLLREGAAMKIIYLKVTD